MIAPLAVALTFLASPAPATDGMVWSALREAERHLGAAPCDAVYVYDEPDPNVMGRGRQGDGTFDACGVFVPRHALRGWRQQVRYGSMRVHVHAGVCSWMWHERRHNLGDDHSDPGMDCSVTPACQQYGKRIVRAEGR